MTQRTFKAITWICIGVVVVFFTVYWIPCLVQVWSQAHYWHNCGAVGAELDRLEAVRDAYLDYTAEYHKPLPSGDVTAVLGKYANDIFGRPYKLTSSLNDLARVV
jgi:hypothetical protein